MMLRSSNPISFRSRITKRNMIGGPHTNAVVFSTGTVTPRVGAEVPVGPRVSGTLKKLYVQIVTKASRDVREVEVKGDRAIANVFYDGHYRVSTASGEAAIAAIRRSRRLFWRPSRTRNGTAK